MNRPGRPRILLDVSRPVAGAVLLLLVFAWLGCAGISPKGRQARRAHALMARDRAVAAVDAQSPGEKARIGKAVGYAVIESATEMPYELPPGYGFGVLHTKSSGKNTFLLVLRQGPDANVPMPTRILIFEDTKTLANFDQGALAADAKTPAALPLDAEVEVLELLESGAVGAGSTTQLRYWYDKDVGG